jgi:hypothetical protein
MLVVLFARWPAPPRGLTEASLFFPAYYGALSLALTLRRKPDLGPTRPKPPRRVGR